MTRWSHYNWKLDVAGPKKILPSWRIYNSKRNPKTCILALPGRTQKGQEIADACDYMQLNNTLIVGVTPENLCWYPMPFSAEKQSNALEGLPYAVDAVKRVVKRIEEKFGIEQKDIALVGWSAGAVTALWSSFHLNTFAAVVSFGGAILEPDDIPTCNNDTDYLVIHGKNDMSFEWDERFRPMYYGLKDNSYHVYTAIRRGGHSLNRGDVIMAGGFLSKVFKYDTEKYFNHACDKWGLTFSEVSSAYKVLHF